MLVVGPLLAAPQRDAAVLAPIDDKNTTMNAVDCIAKDHKQLMVFDETWAHCFSNTEGISNTEATNLVQTDGKPGLIDRAVASWTKVLIPDPASEATWNNLFEDAKAKAQKHPTGAVEFGGSMLAVPGFSKAMVSAIGLVADTTPESALPHVSRWLERLTTDHDLSASFYRTAVKYPQLQPLMQDITDRVLKHDFIRNYPNAVELATRYVAMANTTDVKPYEPAAPSLAASFLEKFGGLW